MAVVVVLIKVIPFEHVKFNKLQRIDHHVCETALKVKVCSITEQ